jgi:hypothetical protein
MIASCDLQSWVLEDSVDSRTWVVRDRRTNTEHFKGYVATASFSAQNQVDCRYLRLTQTGRNHGVEQVNHLCLSAVEFFGSLYEPRYF